MSRVYRWCLISHCKNNSGKLPEKVFLQVPSQTNIRRLWLEAAGRDLNEFSPTTSLFVCQDHFDLSNDMENFVKWKIMGGVKKIKKDVIPHKRLLPMPEMENRMSKISRCDANKDTIACYSQSDISEPNSTLVKPEVKPHYRSKCIQVAPDVRHQQCSPIKPSIQSETSSSPLQIQLLKSTLKQTTFKPRKLVYSSDFTSTASPSTFLPATSPATHTSSNDEDFLDGKSAAELASKLTIRNINLNPKRYLGITKDCLWLIPEIQKHTELDNISIYITFKKIKTAHTFAELADDFGVNESTATRMFKNAVPLISPLMKELIVWPSNQSIQNQLPKAFRARYGKVGSIIDCLEIEINKPSDPVKQALTWSEYKKANTLKYLISSTPDGIINFVSKGYGGRTTDQIIVEDCGYLEVLRPGTVVMADRGFKNIDKLLCDKQCILVRPPSVSSTDKLTKAQVLSTKRIASLRIHIERVIRRLREYKFLKPHSCIHSKLIGMTDHICYIVCGLINLQDPLIK